MKDMIYITGHRNPDTDSICSALAYAEFKNKSANVKAKPIRLGEVSRETQFALDYFKVQKPELVKTLRPLVKDLEMDKVPPLTPETSLKTAWFDMKKYKVKTIPVVDNDNKFLGIVSLSNLTSAYMDIWDNYILTKSKTPLKNVIDALSARTLYENKDLEFCGGKIIVAAMNPESMKKIMETGDVVICGDREDTQMSIIENKASLMIVAGNHEVSKKVLDFAEANKCTVISTPFDSFTASRMIVQSIPIRYVMSKEELICFRDTDHVEDVREAMAKTRFRSYPILDSNNKVLGMISRFHLISRVNKKVILVDHNESAQSVDGLETAEVTEIIDHHRIADIQTSNPIYFRNQPVGCTGTIIGSIFFENGLTPSKETAGLLCSAIISDTLLFKSPTSTPVDKAMVEKLAKIAEIDVEEYAKEMFKAGTSLVGRTVEEIFNTDFKTFSLLNHKVGVAQVSTMDIEGFKPMKEEMLNYMEKNCEENNYDLLVLLLTDIIQDGSEVMAVGNRADYIERAFNVTLKDNSAYVPGLLSRKKQVIPPITKAIELSQE
ncbi:MULTISPECIES: putative manganese-dependent inorganic diphosphatase [Clostridium]|uniref:putative manganese-dependent inorganic diphosphatase n=1 Tax=Clostridium TaxID=1485 RepID=UPI0004D495FD|nr:MULTISPECIES: putative manganese-dependent inorganic diphosphatase [Clostridium]KEH86049.1 inorganic pyrophosphatase [Clostridium novyi A str. NCTC 538]KEH87923.1 inorganic pyrophosphatase [Clostridium novyi A str. 4540]KEH88318.1 inorganic pyrophosphatase [Clostridium novyi A str. BKT29909]KEH93452.1 inorganic pyrophosphatase [Clostridium botulinum C/D str. It1]KEH94553.1 inorganic pyrophosphatase [Clostridium novyi A str. GD211209]